jgi:hypothetical protein
MPDFFRGGKCVEANLEGLLAETCIVSAIVRFFIERTGVAFEVL